MAPAAVPGALAARLTWLVGNNFIANRMDQAPIGCQPSKVVLTLISIAAINAAGGNLKMTGKQLVEFSHSFSWDGCSGAPKDRGRQPNVARPLNSGQKSRQRLAPSLRPTLFALAFSLGGALLFILVGLFTVVVLADDHCGPRFRYYGCGVPGRPEVLTRLPTQASSSASHSSARIAARP
jgi:hypothetical protein